MTLKSILFPAVSAVFVLGTLASCVDSDKDLFDSDSAKELYDETYPVKNIDPNMDWKTTDNVSIVVSVNEDAGVDYRVRIYDENPLSSTNNARLLAEGTANDKLIFNTTFDAPKALDAVYILRTDEKNRHLLKYASIENGQVKTSFGSNQVTTRATRSDVEITKMETPYSNTELQSMLDRATEVQSSWDLGAQSDWGNNYNQYDVFKIPETETRYFKITSPYQFTNTSNKGYVKLLITSTVTVNVGNLSLGGDLEFIILDGGKIELNQPLNSWGKMRFTVLEGGEISGNSTLKMSNGSQGEVNYNAGIINVNTLEVTNSDAILYNCGTINVDKLNFTNEGRYINQGQTIINSSQVNIAIENACYFEAVDLAFTTIKCGPSSAIKTQNISSYNGSRTITMAANSMITVLNDANLEQNKYIGPSTGFALVKLETIKNAKSFATSGNIYFENNNIDLGYDAPEWQMGFLEAMKNSDGVIAKIGESPIYIPAGECTGEGNGQNESGTDVPDAKFINYTYAFEDNFPQPGDYDFNDIVLNVSTDYIRTQGSNNIESVKLYVTLRAIGATKKIGAGLRIVDLKKSDIESIVFGGRTEMRNTLASSVFEQADMESGNEVVIPLFGDAHAVYGIEATRSMVNTGYRDTDEIHTLEITINLTDKNQTAPIITQDNLDFFIAYALGSSAKRTEVHLYEFITNGATVKGDVHEANQDAAGNKTWAIRVPEFNYPTEKTSIVVAYPNFTNWAQNREVSIDWYNHPTSEGGKIYTNTFN